MLDAAILTAFKDQRARLEKLRDDVESNGLMIPGGIVAAKSQEPLDEFLRMWFESKTGVILNSYCGSCSYTDIAKYEHDHFWLLLSQRTGFGHPTIRHDDVQVDGWHMFFSREWRTGASDDSRISDNERARSRYHNIAKELTELLVSCRYPFPFERNSWTSALFGLALDGHLIGKPLRKDFFRDKQLNVKDCWLAIIPNLADYSIAAIDWLIANWPTIASDTSSGDVRTLEVTAKVEESNDTPPITDEMSDAELLELACVGLGHVAEPMVRELWGRKHGVSFDDLANHTLKKEETNDESIEQTLKRVRTKWVERARNEKILGLLELTISMPKRRATLKRLPPA